MITNNKNGFSAVPWGNTSPAASVEVSTPKPAGAQAWERFKATKAQEANLNISQGRREWEKFKMNSALKVQQERQSMSGIDYFDSASIGGLGLGEIDFDTLRQMAYDGKIEITNPGNRQKLTVSWADGWGPEGYRQSAADMATPMRSRVSAAGSKGDVRREEIHGGQQEYGFLYPESNTPEYPGYRIVPGSEEQKALVNSILAVKMGDSERAAELAKFWKEEDARREAGIYSHHLTDPEFAEYANKGASLKSSLPEKAEEHRLSLMTDGEKRMYHYLLAKEGNDSAIKYLEHINNQLLARMGQYVAEKVESTRGDHWLPNLEYVLQSGGLALASGVDQTLGGFEQLFSDEKVDPSALQYANYFFSKDLEGIDKVAYGIVNQVGGMTPMLLTTTAASAIGVPAPVVGVLGATMVGLPAAGNAYTEALEKGYDKERAKIYAACIGASEAGLQYLLGGISKAGGIGAESLLTRVAALDSALFRFAGTVAVKGGAEAIEETLQSFLEPLFKTMIFEEDYDLPTWEEIIYTALVSFVTGNLLETNETADITIHGDGTNGIGQSTPGKEMMKEFAADAIDNAVAKVTGKKDAQENAQNAAENVSAEKGVVAQESPANVTTGAGASSTGVNSQSARDEALAATIRQGQENLARAEAEKKSDELTPQQKSFFDSFFGREKTVSESDTAKKSQNMSAAQLRQQIEVEYAAGQLTEDEYDSALDALMEQESLEGVNTLDRYNPEMMKVEVNDNVRGSVSDDSSQRYESTSAGEQTGELAEGTGRDQSGQVQSRLARDRADHVARIHGDQGQQPVTARSYLGSKYAEDSGQIYDVPQSVIDGDTELSEIAADIRSRGLVPHLFTGEARLVNGSTADAMIRGNDVYIRVDSPTWTAKQNWEHEKFHGILGKSREMISDLWQQMRKKMPKEKLWAICERYREAYHGIIDVDANGNPITGEDLTFAVAEEILADAYAGKDTFAQDVEQFSDIANDAASQIEESGEEIRGPPEGKPTIVEDKQSSGGYRVIVDRDIFAGVPDDEKNRVLKDFLFENLRGAEIETLIDQNILYISQKNKDLQKLVRPGVPMKERKYNARREVASHFDELTAASKLDDVEQNKKPAERPNRGDVQKRIVEVEIPSWDSNGKLESASVWQVELSAPLDLISGLRTSYDISSLVDKTKDTHSLLYRLRKAGLDVDRVSLPKTISENMDVVKPKVSGRFSASQKSIDADGEVETEKPADIADDSTYDEATQDPVQAFPKKAQRVLETEERKLTNLLANALRIPYKSRSEQLDGIARAITTEFLQTGRVSEKTVEDLFEKAYRPNEQKLAEEHGIFIEEYRDQMEQDFKAQVNNLIAQLRLANRYAAEQSADDSGEGSAVPTLADVPGLYADMKAARRAADKAVARNLLTESDNIKVNRLLRGDIDETMLNPLTDNVTGILEVFQAKAEYEKFARKLRSWNAQRKAELYALADKLLETAGEWKDKTVGLLYSRETMERNVRDIVKDKKVAEEIINTIFKPVHDAAAKATAMKNQYRDRVRALKLSRKVAAGNKISEAAAVQLLGEAEDNIRYLQKNKFIKERDGKSLEDWQGIVQDLWESNPKLDAKKIRNAVNEFRQIYDDLFEQMNDARMRNGYEPVNYRKGYFPHFQSDSGDGILSQFGKSLGINTAALQLPTTINGMTHTFKPGIQWFGSAQQRQGVNTSFDAVEGFDSYIEGVADVIHQTDNIQRLRAFATQVRYRTSDEGLRKQIDKVREDPTIAEEDKQNRIKEIFENGKFELGNFAVELDEYTNLLAGKKSRHDRDMEQKLGRRMYAIMKAMEGRVAANMVAVNPGSWLTNFIPITQAWATLDSRSLLAGMWDTLRAYKDDDGMVALSSFLTNRRGSDPIVRTWSQNASAVLSRPMSIIDSFTADTLVRARYGQNIRRGMSEAAAIADADSWAAGVMADRSKGAMPTIFAQTNPVAKLFTQFQLEVNNQLSYTFKDIPRETREKGAAAIAMAMLKFMIGAFLYDELYEYFIGRRPALDPLGIINDTVGDLTGYELPNLIELGTGIFTGDMPSFEVEKKGVYDAGVNLATAVAEELPFVGGLLGGGRVPISSALPDVGKLWQAATDDSWAGEKRLSTAAKELAKPAFYLAPPFGGGQLKKAVEGAAAVSRGGSYTVDNTGEDILQYPIENDTFGQAGLNAITAMFFGKSALPEAREWVESDFDSLTAKQTALFDALRNGGVSTEDAYSLIRDVEDADTNLEKISEVANSYFDEFLKELAMSNVMTDSQYQKYMDARRAGVSSTAYYKFLSKIEDLKQTRGSKSVNQEDVKTALEASSLTDAQKRAIWNSYGWKTESPW